MVARYFAYGSNMNPDRVRERGIGFQRAVGASISGFALVFDKRSRLHTEAGHANLVVARGGRVEGVLYFLDHADEIQKMDRFESAPVNYSREIVEVSLTFSSREDPAMLPTDPDGGSPTRITSWTYFANPAVRRIGLKPPRSYLNHLLAGRPFLSEDYHAWLAQHPCEESR